MDNGKYYLGYSSIVATILDFLLSLTERSIAMVGGTVECCKIFFATALFGKETFCVVRLIGLPKKYVDFFHVESVEYFLFIERHISRRK